MSRFRCKLHLARTAKLQLDALAVLLKHRPLFLSVHSHSWTPRPFYAAYDDMLEAGIGGLEELAEECGGFNEGEDNDGEGGSEAEA